MKIEKLQRKIDEECEMSAQFLARVNHGIVRKALSLMKGGKFENFFNTVSDQYINAPSNVIDHLVLLIRTMFSHGHGPDNLLVCSLFPLVKDNICDMTKSANYRAIGGSCPLLKVIDLVIILLESDPMMNCSLPTNQSLAQ